MKFIKPVRFIQESLITEQCLSWTKEDKIFIFCTSGAEVSNWNDYGQTQIKAEIEKDKNQKGRFENALNRANVSNIKIIDLQQIRENENQLFNLIK